MAANNTLNLDLKILEAYTRDVGRGVARIDYDSMPVLLTFDQIAASQQTALYYLNTFNLIVGADVGSGRTNFTVVTASSFPFRPQFQLCTRSSPACVVCV